MKTSVRQICWYFCLHKKQAYICWPGSWTLHYLTLLTTDTCMVVGHLCMPPCMYPHMAGHRFMPPCGTHIHCITSLDYMTHDITLDYIALPYITRNRHMHGNGPPIHAPMHVSTHGGPPIHAPMCHTHTLYCAETTQWT